MPKLIQVHFRKSPTGAFKLGYHVGDIGFVRPQMAQALLNAGYIDPITINEPEAVEYKPSAKIEKPKEASAADLTTKEGVAAKFGDDLDALRKYCDDKKIKYGAAAKRPEYFWGKVAKHHKSK